MGDNAGQNSMEFDLIILTYLSNRDSPLTYYQLDRKLSTDNQHRFLRTLREKLDELEFKGLISSISSDKVEGIKLYSITEKGRLAHAI